MYIKERESIRLSATRTYNRLEADSLQGDVAALGFSRRSDGLFSSTSQKRGSFYQATEACRDLPSPVPISSKLYYLGRKLVFSTLVSVACEHLLFITLKCNYIPPSGNHAKPRQLLLLSPPVYP